MLSLDLVDSFKSLSYRLRASVLTMTTRAGSGHPTSSFSCVEMMIVLVWYAMRFDPHKKFSSVDDQFILSKGHAVPLWYAIWHELGILSQHDLDSFRQFGSRLEGHPSTRFERVQVATGSLGQGLAVAVGMALDARIDGYESRTYVLMGDSELSEGSVWEAASLASFYKLPSLVLLVDCNQFGQTDKTVFAGHEEVYQARFEAFGWHVYTIDGHSFEQLVSFFDQVLSGKNTKPIVLLARTIKGYPLEYWAGKNGFHGKVLPADKLSEALLELEEQAAVPADLPAPYIHLPTKLDAPDLSSENTNTLMFPVYAVNEIVPPRRAFGEALASLSSDPLVCVLDAEVKNSTYTELFERVAPHRFFQVGIAEQAMVGIGMGFAARKKRVCMATFGAFLTRAHDQLRMAAISHLPLLVAGTHCGVSIGADGPSQMALEDIALFRSLPESVVLYPADAQAAAQLTRAAIQMLSHTIIYLRLTRNELPVLYSSETLFPIPGAHVLKKSNQDVVCLIGAGITVHEALKAYELLKSKGIAVAVLDLYCIKPLPVEFLKEIAAETNNQFLIFEDHYAAGGIGEAICTALHDTCIKIKCSAVIKVSGSGTTEQLLKTHRLDFASQVASVLAVLNLKT